MDTKNLGITTSTTKVYQCIVCQMPTISLSHLHRHQTYRHTLEELSLSTIGRQCLMINKLEGTDNIVYDNSWLSDPLKQAEFYTVSAKLLTNFNNNNNVDCTPINYSIKKIYQKQQNFCNLNNYNNTNDETKNIDSQIIDKLIEETKNIDSQIFDKLIEETKNIDSHIIDKLIEETKNIDSHIIDKLIENTKNIDSHIIDRLIEEKKINDTTQIDIFDNCVKELCDDLKKMESQKRKRTSRNSAPKQIKNPAKPRASRKKPKILDNSMKIIAPKNDIKKEFDNLDCTKEKSKVINNSDKLNITTENIYQFKEPEIKIFKNKNASTVEDNSWVKKYPIVSKLFGKTIYLEPTEIKMEADIVEENTNKTEIQIPLTRSIEMEIKVDSMDNLTKVESDIEGEENFIEDKSLIEDMISEDYENFMSAATISTFPCYPEDINDCSILVLDPEAHQLVWSSISIDDSSDKSHLKILQETTGLPELTNADLQNSEIGENINISKESDKTENMTNFSRRSTRNTRQRFY